MIVLKKSADGQFYFVVKANNNQVLVTSETYKTKQNAMVGIDALAVAFKTFVIPVPVFTKDKKSWVEMVDETK